MKIKVKGGEITFYISERNVFTRKVKPQDMEDYPAHFKKRRGRANKGNS